MSPILRAAQIMLAIGLRRADFAVMRAFLLLLLTAAVVIAQDDAPATPAPAPPAAPAAPEPQVPQKTLREIWGLTLEQYQLIDPSRRRNGDTYKYFRASHRGPHGNMLERIPGGPRRPLSR